MAFYNLTPHTIRYIRTDGSEAEVPPSGAVARIVAQPGHWTDAHCECPLYGSPIYGDVEGLPDSDPERDVFYIVSAMVAARCIGRPDVVSPGTGPSDGPIRKDGQIHAVTRFILAPTE